MSWKSKRIIFKPNSHNQFLISHASNPLAIHLNGDIFRVYYSGRNIENKSSVGFFDFDIKNFKVIKIGEEPNAIFGNPTSFYSHGISIGCHYQIDNRQFVLFMGWQINGADHWRGDIGRFEILPFGEWRLNPVKPFLSCDELVDKVSLSYPWVIFEYGIYKMWYGSTIDWTSENGEMIHVINYATSIDGENWIRHGLAIPYELGVAQAFSRPCVIHDKNGYHMWFSYRSGDGTPYRIGYARSKNGINWELALNETGISVSETGWDSEMICYPFVFDFKGERYMLFNGNSFGKTGIGIAIWQD